MHQIGIGKSGRLLLNIITSCPLHFLYLTMRHASTAMLNLAITAMTVSLP